MVNVAFLSPVLGLRFGYCAYGGRLSMGGQMSIVRYKVAHARQPEIDLIQASMALGVLEGSVSAVRMSLDKVASRERNVAAALREALNDLAFVSKHLRFAKEKVYQAETGFMERKQKQRVPVTKDLAVRSVAPSPVREAPEYYAISSM
jgi:hypothetical protein